MSIKQLQQDELNEIVGGLQVTAVKANKTLTFDGQAEVALSGVVGNLLSKGHSIANIGTPFPDQELNSGEQGINRE